MNDFEFEPLYNEDVEEVFYNPLSVKLLTFIAREELIAKGRVLGLIGEEDLNVKINHK